MTHLSYLFWCSDIDGEVLLGDGDMTNDSEEQGPERKKRTSSLQHG